MQRICPRIAVETVGNAVNMTTTELEEQLCSVPMLKVSTLVTQVHSSLHYSCERWHPLQGP
jgi:hypothetical protein